MLVEILVASFNTLKGLYIDMKKYLDCITNWGQLKYLQKSCILIMTLRWHIVNRTPSVEPHSISQNKCLMLQQCIYCRTGIYLIFSHA